MTTLPDGLTLDSLDIPVFHTHALVVGSGAAGLACAVRLKKEGCADVTIITDNINGGTSRNTGSDKQTYYRLSDSEAEPDSPYDMASTYLCGGAMHGDIALVESQGSSRAFYQLVSLGVRFPFNKFGGYTGYKTDHDPKKRGISLGPYTSRVMVEKLLCEIKKENIPVLDRHDAIRLLKQDDRIAGVLVMDKDDLASPNFGLKVILCDHLVFCPGGPAGLYDASVYPRVHVGGIGLALEIGAETANLTESQFGIGSKKVRWNLSGSYQQVLPRFYSTDAEGNNAEDFLLPYFHSWFDLTRAIFLKGYQWPFDAGKILDGGSSLIDLLVYRETRVRGRKVFMDYRCNMPGKPQWGEFTKEMVAEIALEYLEASSAWSSTPVERLRNLNPNALDFYRSHGIDLAAEPLEIDVCAQHNNGGLAGDIWWESTNIRRLYPVGEVNGSHGVSRPGGSALNSGQVGAARAALRIVEYGAEDRLDIASCMKTLGGQILPLVTEIGQWISRGKDGRVNVARAKTEALEMRTRIQKRMSAFAGPIRSRNTAAQALIEASNQMHTAFEGFATVRELLPQLLKNRHMLFAQYCYLAAIDGYLRAGGGSRGSYLVVDPEGGLLHPLLEEYRVKEEALRFRSCIQTLRLNADGNIEESFVPCRMLPKPDFWFERVWADFRTGKIFD